MFEKNINIPRLLLGIQSLASTAQWIDIFLIFSIPPLLWNSNPSEIAILAAFFGLPSLFIGPIIGAYIDRSNPLKVMMLGAVLRTVLTALLIFSPNFIYFSIIVFLKGLSNILYWPASNVVINHSISDKERVGFFSSQSAIDQAAKIGTPLVIGLAVSSFDHRLAFLISSVLTLLCVFSIPLLKGKIKLPKTEKIRSVKVLLSDVIKGFNSFGELNKVLSISIILSVGMAFSLAIYDPHLAAFLKNSGLGINSFSVAVSATAIGALFGAFIVKSFFKEAIPFFLIKSGLAVFIASLFIINTIIFIYPDTLNIYTICFSWLINGFGYEVFLIGCIVNFQNLCPKELLGRLGTSIRSIQMVCIVTAPSLGALIISNTNDKAPFLASLIVSLFLFGFILKKTAL